MDGGSSQAVLEAQKEGSVEWGDVGELVEVENKSSSCILDQLQGSDAVQE